MTHARWNWPAARWLTRALAPGRGERDERGSVAVMMCFIVLFCVSLATFLIDAGANISAANRADTYSSEAARAASIAVGPVPVSGGTASLRAAAAARSYLERAGVSEYAVTVVGPATVRVKVTTTDSAPILGFAVSQSRTHTAQLQVGVTKGQGVG